LKELEEGIKGFEKGEGDYGGQHFGTFVHRMIVGKYRDEVTV